MISSYVWWGPDDQFVIDQHERGFARLIDGMVEDSVPSGDPRVIFNATVTNMDYAADIDANCDGSERNGERGHKGGEGVGGNGGGGNGDGKGEGAALKSSGERMAAAARGSGVGGVTVTTQDGRTFHARHQVISTLPLGVLQRKHAQLFSPPLPAAQAKLLSLDSRFAMGNLTHVVVQFRSVWWDNSLFKWVAANKGANASAAGGTDGAGPNAVSDISTCACVHVLM